MIYLREKCHCYLEKTLISCPCQLWSPVMLCTVYPAPLNTRNFLFSLLLSLILTANEITTLNFHHLNVNHEKRFIECVKSSEGIFLLIKPLLKARQIYLLVG